jgi:hypothetical protein
LEFYPFGDTAANGQGWYFSFFGERFFEKSFLQASFKKLFSVAV